MRLEGKTTEELVAMMRAVEADPASREEGGFYLLTKKARKKLDEITRQITHNLAMKRAAEGNPVPCDGYSGRKQKRRR